MLVLWIILMFAYELTAFAEAFFDRHNFYLTEDFRIPSVTKTSEIFNTELPCCRDFLIITNWFLFNYRVSHGSRGQYKSLSSLQQHLKFTSHCDSNYWKLSGHGTFFVIAFISLSNHTFAMASWPNGIFFDEKMSILVSPKRRHSNILHAGWQKKIEMNLCMWIFVPLHEFSSRGGIVLVAHVSARISVNAWSCRQYCHPPI